MASFFNLELDTTAPGSPTISIEGGATYASTQLVTCTIGTGDGDTTGYQMLIWGNVDLAENASIQDTEGNSSWITYNTSQQVKLLTGDGVKTIYLKIRDDVYNESAQVDDSITLDESVPVVTISGPDLSKISKVTGKDVSEFSFTCDTNYEEYKVKVVPASGSSQDAGTLILTANGSSNMSGSAGGYNGATPITCQIDGADLEIASAGDGTKIIKVFVKDAANNWSV